jgi:hypothetical protein
MDATVPRTQAALPRCNRHSHTQSLHQKLGSPVLSAAAIRWSMSRKSAIASSPNARSAPNVSNLNRSLFNYRNFKVYERRYNVRLVYRRSDGVVV